MIVLVHGGAGKYRGEIGKRRQVILRELANAALAGLEELNSGSSVDAVVEAISYMEDSGKFNAGRGSALNAEMEMELDAGIMYGKTLDIGAVGCLRGYWNAIRLARFIMENTDHVLVVGDGAAKLAEYLGLERAEPLERRLKEFEWRKKEVLGGYFGWRKNLKLFSELGYGTVGAVALDKDGNLAAGVSTGGMWIKLPGRLGDSPIPGAGFYADKYAASSATGIGEVIVKMLLTFRISFYVANGMTVENASRKAMSELTEKFGRDTAGVISLDYRGRYSFTANTGLFARAVAVKGERVRAALITDEPLTPI